MDTQQKVYKIVSLIPEGKVLTYGSLARLAGIKSPRVVGNILHKNPDPEKIPCHRVVNSRGEVAKNYAFGGKDVQIGKLILEGVEVDEGRVNLAKHAVVLPLAF